MRERDLDGLALVQSCELVRRLRGGGRRKGEREGRERGEDD
jgi:hypothetical protein